MMNRRLINNISFDPKSARTRAQVLASKRALAGSLANVVVAVGTTTIPRRIREVLYSDYSHITTVSGKANLPSIVGLSSTTTKKLAPNSQVNEMDSQLQALCNLPSNWNSYGAEPPNEEALCWAKVALKTMNFMGISPAKLVPSAEDGISIVFINGEKYADIECFNSGEILGVISDGQGKPQVWEIKPDSKSIKTALEKIREYISA